MASFQTKSGALGRRLHNIIHGETTAGTMLALAAVAAILAANSPLMPLYHRIFDTGFALPVGPLTFSGTVSEWINNGPMALFFLLVSIEIRRELAPGGELSDRAGALLPIGAALGGIIVPALIYILLDLGHPKLSKGWAIPSATDIAFSLGALAILGKRVPKSLRLFLTALAIIDDLGAIVIIAIFYAGSVSIPLLGAMAILEGGLTILAKFKCRLLWPYLLIGAALWALMLGSGIHPTVAGVAVGFGIPPAHGDASAPAARLQAALSRFVALGVLPLFAFANAGVPLAGFGASILISAPVPGIALGLLLGKPLGVMGGAWLAIRLAGARLPAGIDWHHIAGIAILTGIGFTMSLFIGDLAFHTAARFDAARVGILIGSLASGLIGLAFLARTFPRRRS